ncbi:MAG: Ger(x)C family spore germination protein [Moorella humiferrea]|nr:Ger(x)C family spore germination protein [Moorella humiferrea]
MTLFLCLIFLGGCWDNKDLERRALVLGAAVDLAAEGGRAAEPWKITLEMPILRRMVARGGGGGGGGDGGQGDDTMPTWRLTLTGATFAEAINKGATRSERTLFFGHQKIIVLGEELARRDALQSVLDWWTRNRESYVAINVLLAEGDAAAIMEGRPEFARSVSMFLNDEMQQVIKTTRFVKHSLQEVLVALDAGEDILLARVKVLPDGKPQVAGTGVIHRGRLVGWLSPEETQAALWITGETKGCDVLVVPVPELDNVFSLEFCKIKPEIKPKMENESLSFEVKIEFNGRIAEKMGNPGILKAGDLQLVEGKAEAVITERLQQVMSKLQRQYRADVLGFGRRIEKKWPHRWEGMKEQWPQIFAGIPVTLQVKVKILGTGLVS